MQATGMIKFKEGVFSSRGYFGFSSEGGIYPIENIGNSGFSAIKALIKLNKD